jgi:hypothetical protein
MGRIGIAVFFVLPLFLAGCVSPVLKDGETAQIVEVTVTNGGAGSGTANLVEAVRYKTQDAAYRFSEEGPEATLDVTINSLTLANPVRALLIGGNSFIEATATLTDKSTGQSREPVEAFATIPRLGGIIGAFQSAGVNPIEEEQTLTSKLAEDIMRRIYGEDWAKRVANRTARKRATPNFPMSYAEASKKFECDQARKQIELEKQEEEARAGSSTSRGSVGGPPTTLPAHCQVASNQ